MSAITVCKDCADRYIGCHSKCERYIREKEETAEQKAIITFAKNKDRIQRSAIRDSISRMKKKSKKR